MKTLTRMITMCLALCMVLCSLTVMPEAKTHTHNWKTISTREATCTSAKKVTKKCTTCRTTKISYPESAKGHRMRVLDRKDSTCKDRGYVIYKCSREGCGHKEATLKLLKAHRKKTYANGKVKCTVCGHCFENPNRK